MKNNLSGEYKVKQARESKTIQEKLHLRDSRIGGF